MSLKNWEFFQQKAKAAVAEMEKATAEAESLREENRRLRLRIESMENTIALGMVGNRELQKRLDSAYVAISTLGVEFQHEILSIVDEIEKKED